MQIIDRLYKDQKPLCDIERFCETDKALFIDIETTGLSRETTSLYLIGCGYYTADGLMTKLFFADSSAEEYDLLYAFSRFMKGYTHLFHFNGLKFDIPYLSYKARKHGIDGLFDGIVQIDVYKVLAPLRHLLFPESMRQKAIESFLGITREDKYNGKELIDVYKRYEADPTDIDLEKLITHNREDVVGMHKIMQALVYLDLKDAPLIYEGCKVNRYRDLAGAECEELLLSYTTGVSFPVSFMAKTESMYIKASASTGKLLIRLPIYDTEMKLFYDSYRDYRYIPEEDTAILKELAAALPKGSYVKATKENCYTRVSGRFVKQPQNLFTPVVRTSYKDKKKYFRFPDSFNEKAAEQFGRQLINVFFTLKK
ncbi:MAG: ribonuclease H-like domain-containing protein [Lachnospiraceae bacterium]|nr:ribonuclease H-like domain-containing protein [Lachnospiraceae bacterium]